MLYISYVKHGILSFFELTIDKKGETDGQRDYNKDEYTLKHLTY